MAAVNPTAAITSMPTKDVRKSALDGFDATTSDSSKYASGKYSTITLPPSLANLTHAQIIEKQMHSYIEEKLKAMRRAPATKSSSEEAVSTNTSIKVGESKSSTTPAQASLENNVQAKPILQLTSATSLFSSLGKPSNPDDLESGDRWLTGISEVQLSTTEKLANAARTERALAERNLKRSHASQNDVIATPGNLSANYAHHKRVFDQRIFEQRAQTTNNSTSSNPTSSHFHHSSHPNRSHQHRNGPKASDSQVVDRFLKRHRYK